MPIGLHDSVTMPRPSSYARASGRGDVGVELDLVDVRHDAGRGDHPLEVRGLEVGDPDRPQEARLHQLDQARERLDVAVVRGGWASG